MGSSESRKQRALLVADCRLGSELLAGHGHSSLLGITAAQAEEWTGMPGDGHAEVGDIAVCVSALL